MTPEMRAALLEVDFAVENYLHLYRSEVGIQTFANLDTEHVVATDWAARLTYLVRSLLDRDADRRRLDRPQLALAPHGSTQEYARMAADIQRRISHAHRLSLETEAAAERGANAMSPPQESPPDLPGAGQRPRGQQ